MKKTALLIDGGWFAKGLGDILKLPFGWPTAEQVRKNAVSVLEPDEELFRFFYYDCEPFGQELVNPVDGSRIDYSTTGGYRARQKYLFELGQMPFVALRRGQLKARGWEFSSTYRKTIFAGKPPPKLTATDVFPNFQQKGVDMRIGIDVATLSLKRIVERIVLFSGDTDMIPALKLARREGIQVFVVKLEPWDLKHELIEDSDGVRSLKPAPGASTPILPHSVE